MGFTHSISEIKSTISADGTSTYDLPTGPLSALLLEVSPLNDTGTIGNYRYLEGLISALTSIRVTHLGASIFDMNGQDAGATALLYHGIGIHQSGSTETNNDRRHIVLPILFGRNAYDANECIPATNKGELQLQVTFDIANTGYDGLQFGFEAIELPDAQPGFVEKKTTISQTFAATGQNDIDLPIGHLLRSCLLFGTTAHAGATPAPTLGQLSFYLNNRQTRYASSNFEGLRGSH